MGESEGEVPAGTLALSIVAVGEACGFAVDGGPNGTVIITAAHVLPSWTVDNRDLVPIRPRQERFADERRIPDLVGSLGYDGRFAVECIFVDLVADVAILASPDPSSPSAAESIRFFESQQPLRFAPAHVEPKQAFVFSPFASFSANSGWWVALDGLRISGSALVHRDSIFEFGTAGGPVIDAQGHVVAIIASEYYQPRLPHCLPRRFEAVTADSTDRKREQTAKNIQVTAIKKDASHIAAQFETWSEALSEALRWRQVERVFISDGHRLQEFTAVELRAVARGYLSGLTLRNQGICYAVPCSTCGGPYLGCGCGHDLFSRIEVGAQVLGLGRSWVVEAIEPTSEGPALHLSNGAVIDWAAWRKNGFHVREEPRDEAVDDSLRPRDVSLANPDSLDDPANQVREHIETLLERLDSDELDSGD